MGSFFQIAKTDLKNIFRDYAMVMMLFVPLLIMSLLRWAYPFFLEAVPEAAAYNMLLLCMLAMTSGSMPAMTIAFSILDEKDNGLLPVLMVLPVSFRRIILARIALITAYSAAATFIVISFSRLSDGSVYENFLLALLAAAPAVSLGLIPAFFAANKIEGATMAKVLNFFLIFPLPAFLFSGWWTNLLMVFPAWWVFQAFTATGESLVFYAAVVVGLAYHALVTVLIINTVFRKVHAV
jgi:hypothetical protein